jgi:RNA polymerase sigma-70 factor, ECF subfamily
MPTAVNGQNPLNSVDCLQKIAAGDLCAFENLFKNYYSQLCHFANAYTGDADASEDAVSEVFARIWERRTQLSIDISVKSYLYRSVANQCIDTLRKTYHKKTTLTSNIISYEDRVVSAGLNEQSEAKELAQKIEQAVRQLPRQCGIIFRLSREAGLKYHQIAAELGISIKTVETQMGRAFKFLRTALAKHQMELWAA